MLLTLEGHLQEKQENLLVVLAVMDYLQELIHHSQVVEVLVEAMVVEVVLQDFQLVEEEEVMMIHGTILMSTDMEEMVTEVHTIL